MELNKIMASEQEAGMQNNFTTFDLRFNINLIIITSNFDIICLLFF